MIAAHVFRHLLFYGFERSIVDLRAETRQFEVSEGPALPNTAITLGSNATAVGPTRTEAGSTLLMINSHQPLIGPVSWYEAHLQSGEGLNAMGGLFIGAPALGVGFTEHHGWGATVNQPDLVDTYVLDIDPADENRYRVDGEWLELEAFDINIKVRLFGGYHRRGVSRLWSGHENGPWHLRYITRAWTKFARSNNGAMSRHLLEERRDAIALQHIASFNFVYANADGDIHFIHNAMMPRRAKGWQWDQYLPGDRSDLIWNDYLSITECLA